MKKKPTLAELNSQDYDPRLYQRIRIKRDPKRCPNCFHRSVSRDARKCAHCGKRLLFSGDDGAGVVEDWFMFYRSIFNFSGYFHRSFFTSEPLIK